MKRQHRVSAKCPWYKCEERHEIFCAGPCECTSIHLAFAIPREKMEWIEEHCKKVEPNCPIADALSSVE